MKAPATEDERDRDAFRRELRLALVSLVAAVLLLSCIGLGVAMLGTSK